MTNEEKYIKCVKKLDMCLHDIKIISIELGDLISLRSRNAMLDIGAGVEKLERELENNLIGGKKDEL